MDKNHPDCAILSPISKEIIRLAGGQSSLARQIPLIAQDAVDYVLDPVTTGRTRISELDNVEKTFVGLKIEHLLRSFLKVPKGLRDLVINGVDVDVKNTVANTWTIPPESYNAQEPLLLVMVSERTDSCSLGLILAKEEYLNAGKNRDAKKAISSNGRNHILWLVRDQPLPDSRWAGLDMARFRELRGHKGGTVRAANFFRENPGKRIDRSVIQSLLHDQLDFMKRIRGNGGARDILIKEHIAILSGVYDAPFLYAYGLPAIAKTDHIAINLTTDQTSAYTLYSKAKTKSLKLQTLANLGLNVT